MSDNSGESVTLFTKDDTSGEYVEYTPPGFADQLPEDFREAEHFKEIGDLGTLAQAYHQLKTAKPDAPETPDGYALPELNDDIKGLVDEAGIKDFRQLAFEAKMPQELFQKLIQFDLARATKYKTEFESAVKKEREAAENALKDLWKTDFDSNKETASRGLRMVIGSMGEDGPKIEEALKAKGFMDDPAVIRLFHKIGVAVSEDAFTPGATAPKDFQRDRAGRPMIRYKSMPGAAA